MFKDLIKFTAKISIFAVIFIYFVAPHIPGLPKVGDLLHLPSWQDAAKAIMDPADLIGKGNQLQDWVHSKMPDIKIAGHSLPKPNFAPPNVFSKDKSNEDKAKDILDPGGLLH
jgi:hypothetical protein